MSNTTRLTLEIGGDARGAVAAAEDTKKAFTAASQAVAGLGASAGTASTALSTGVTTSAEQSSAAMAAFQDDMRIAMVVLGQLQTEMLETMRGTANVADGMVEASEGATTSLTLWQERMASVRSVAQDAHNAFGAVNQAVELVGRTFRLGVESAERYFSTTDEGRQMWQELSEQGRAFKASLFEIVIGTDDQTEAFERLTDILGDVKVVWDGVVDVISPVAQVVLAPLRAGFGLLADTLRAVDVSSRVAAAGIDTVAVSSANALQTIDDLNEAYRDYAGRTAEGQMLTTEQAISEFERGLARSEAVRILEQFRPFMEEGARGTENLRENIEGLTDAIMDGGVSAVQLNLALEEGLNAPRQVVLQLGRDVRTLDTLLQETFIDGVSAISIHNDMMVEAATAADAYSETLAPIRDTTAEIVPVVHQETEALGNLAAQLDLVTLKRKEQSEAIYASARATADLLRQQAEEMVASLEGQKWLGSDVQAANIDALKSGIEAKNDALLRHNELSAEAADRSRALQQMSSSALSSVYSLAEATASSFADGMGSAQQDAGKIIGEITNSLAMAAAAMLPILSTPPFGNPLVGVGVAAAIGAMRAVAGRLGASSGDSGGTSVAASTPTYNTTNGLYIVNNMGDVGQMSDVSGLNMDQLRYAREQGFYGEAAS